LLLRFAARSPRYGSTASRAFVRILDGSVWHFISGVSSFPEPSGATKEIRMILLIIILVLLFAGGGGYWGYNNYGPTGGLGIVGLVLLILLVCYLAGIVRF
jgi:hypothetical protein